MIEVVALPDDCPDEILCTEEDVFALLSTLIELQFNPGFMAYKWYYRDYNEGTPMARNTDKLNAISFYDLTFIERDLTFIEHVSLSND